MKYKPGLIVGGAMLQHDCSTSRSIGYYLEPLVILGLFGKKVAHSPLRHLGVSVNGFGLDAGGT